MPNSNEGRKTITIFSAKTLHLLNGLWRKNSSRRGEREREKESKGNGGETRRRSKFETVKIPKNLSYLIPLPLHVRRAFSLFLPPFSTLYTRLFVRQIRLTTCPVYPIRRTTTRTRSHRSRSACRTTRAWNRGTRPRTAGGGGSSAR